MGVLLSHMLNESKIATHIRAFENYDKSDNLEATENNKEKRTGITKTRSTKWIAHKVANRGDHYQFVAQKSVHKRAVSKEILTKLGLISFLNYYQR